MKKWKFTFWFAVFIFAIGLITTPMSNQITQIDVYGLVFFGLTLIPLYGFAYNVAIGSKIIAISIFTINALLTCLGLYSTAVITYANFCIGQLISSSVALLFMYAFMYPQYAYAFKSNKLWSTNA